MEPDTDTNPDLATSQATRGPGQLTPGQERGLKMAIVVMGVMIVVGLLAIVARVVYLAGGRVEQAPAATASSSEIPAETRLALPAGASVRNMVLSGDRLAIHHDGPAGSGITVVDVRNGRVLSRIVVTPEAPR